MTALASARSAPGETVTAPLLTALRSASTSSCESISLGFITFRRPSLDDEFGEEHLAHRLSAHRLVPPCAHLGLDLFPRGVIEQALERRGAQHADRGVQERGAMLPQPPHLFAGRNRQLDRRPEITATVGLGHVDD